VYGLYVSAICIIGAYCVDFPVGYESWRIAGCNHLRDRLCHRLKRAITGKHDFRPCVFHNRHLKGHLASDEYDPGRRREEYNFDIQFKNPWRPGVYSLVINTTTQETEPGQILPLLCLRQGSA